MAGRLAILPGNRASATRRSRTPVKQGAFPNAPSTMTYFQLNDSTNRAQAFCCEEQRAAGIDILSRAGGAGHFHGPVLKSLARLMGTLAPQRRRRCGPIVLKAPLLVI